MWHLNLRLLSKAPRVFNQCAPFRFNGVALEPQRLRLLRLMTSCLWNDSKRLAFMDYLLAPCGCISKSGNSTLHQPSSQVKLFINSTTARCYKCNSATLFSPRESLVTVFVPHKLRGCPDSSPGGCCAALETPWLAGNEAGWTDSGSQPAIAHW